MNRAYKVDWIIYDQLAISHSPSYEKDQKKLIQFGIKNILCLCYKSEIEDPEFIFNPLNFNRYALPDHKSSEEMNITQLEEVLDILDELITKGPTLVHCLAGMERSPIVCITWLMRTKKISFIDAYEYVKGVHIETSPLNTHMKLVKSNLNLFPKSK